MHFYMAVNLTYSPPMYVAQLGDKCIQICHLGRYIVRYTVGNFVLRRRVSERISDDIPPQMTNLNMVIPILMYFLTLHIKTRHLLQNISCMSEVYQLR